MMAAQRRWLVCQSCGTKSEVVVQTPCGHGPCMCGGRVGIYWPIPGESFARFQAGLPTRYPQERGDWSTPTPIPEDVP